MADEGLTIRRAAEPDEALLRALWEEFEREVPEPAGFDPETWEQEWGDTLDDIRGGGVFLAEDQDGAVGVARIEAPRQGAAHIQLVYVRDRARRRGATKALLQACVEDAKARGARTISLDVLTTNESALAIWRRLGFHEIALTMATPLDALEGRLAAPAPAVATATTHVQTDDEVSVGRALAEFVPRPESPQVSANGSWIRIADPLFDRDRDAQARLARELSERLGGVTLALSLEGEVVRFRLYERGRMVDEYLSVPTYYGALPKGDELALAANPTLVSRLTGADRDEVRRVARNGSSPDELPPAPELYESIARMMGLEP
jgi:ribosomal protein S18 acetylase RimI-like enzyme